ncbi:MAG TPA: hypothetical protein EYH12_00030 [Psychromonas hadalis]|nr:hypothetical protein [Psychromonas hadalis]
MIQNRGYTIASPSPLLVKVLIIKGFHKVRLSHSLLITAFSLFATVACTTAPPKEEEIITERVVRKDFSKILEENYRGKLIIESRSASFQPCDSDEKFPVYADHTLRNIYEEISSEADKSVYVEFTGEITFPTESKADKHAVMRIDRVHHMTMSKRSLQCKKVNDNFRFKAFGNTPIYWRISIENSKLSFASKIKNESYSVESSTFRTTQINKISAFNRKGKNISVVIKPSHCYDKKRNEYWGYKTSVASIHGNFTGCGEPGWPTYDKLFDGYYQSKNNGIHSHLTLEKNHSVTFEQAENGRIITKTGYWKTNNPNNLVIILTQEVNKDEDEKDNIKEEYVFYRKGVTLTTTALNKDNIITSFSDNPMVFDKIHTDTRIDLANENVDAPYLNPTFAPARLVPSTEVDLRVQKAVLDYFKSHRTDPKTLTFSSVRYDLNNDGFKDAIAFIDWCSKSSCEILVFQGTKRGLKFSSRISRVSAPLTVAKKQRYSWQSLLVQKAGDDKNTYILDFNGLSYPPSIRNLEVIEKEMFETDVLLFADGIPADPAVWHRIKE